MNDVHDLLGAYCTDSLDPQERADFEIHLQGCAECRAEAADFREVLAALADMDPVAPPDTLEDLVVARAGTASADRSGPASNEPVRLAQQAPGTVPAQAPAPVSSHRGWRTAAPWMAAAAAGFVLFAAGVGVGRQQAPLDPVASDSGMADVVAVASAGDAHVMAVDIMGTTSRLVVSDEMDKSIFLASELPMPAKGMCYQVWRVTQDGQMVSAGAFTPDDEGHIAAVLDGGVGDVEKFMITIEPPGGSDHPTGEMLGEVDA